MRGQQYAMKKKRKKNERGMLKGKIKCIKGTKKKQKERENKKCR